MFIIPADTELSVCKDDGDKQWKRHVTRRKVSFTGYQHFDGNAYVFKYDDFLILVQKKKLQSKQQRLFQT